MPSKPVPSKPIKVLDPNQAIFEVQVKIQKNKAINVWCK
jgi:hypothetical protein